MVGEIKKIIPILEIKIKFLKLKKIWDITYIW